MSTEDGNELAAASQQWALQLLDHNPTAMLLLDSQHRVIYANRSAARLCAAEDGISMSAEGIVLLLKQDDDRFKRMVAGAYVGRAAATAPDTLRVARPSGKRAYVVVVAQVAERGEASKTAPAVWIIVTDPDGGTPLSCERLRAAFGLTDAEARLAVRLGAGEGLRTAALELGITYGTARARLAGIFEKTQTRRQGELIKVLLTTDAAID